MTALAKKPVFDFVRGLLGRGFAQPEVEKLDALLDGRVVPDAPSEPERDYTPMPERISDEGVALIKRFEGCARLRLDGLVEAYPDPGTNDEPWTIGWGSTGLDTFNGGRIQRGTVWTQEQCDERARHDYVRYARDVARALEGAVGMTSQAQFDALVSFHYNTGAIARATLTAKHKAGDFEGAAREFRRWNRAGGRVLKGLVRRRQAEEALYRKGM